MVCYNTVVSPIQPDNHKREIHRERADTPILCANPANYTL